MAPRLVVREGGREGETDGQTNGRPREEAEKTEREKGRIEEVNAYHQREIGRNMRNNIL
jgi:hypothetical protein